MSLKEQHVPEILKGAIMVPVPKSSCPKTHRDFRPVALTSILMKTFEKMVRTELLRKTECVLDPLQFAYRPDRGVEDARVTLLIQYSVIWRDPDLMPGFYLLTSVQLLTPSSPIF